MIGLVGRPAAAFRLWLLAAAAAPSLPFPLLPIRFVLLCCLCAALHCRLVPAAQHPGCVWSGDFHP